MIKILAISGSLRRHSSNRALLEAAQKLADDSLEISLYQGLGDLPLFNPDLEGYEASSVLAYRSCIKQADGVLIASPEYAHGITGALKNALDWIVGSGELIKKPVALLNASARAFHAHAALKEVIQTMYANYIEEASKTIPLPSNQIDTSGILNRPDLVKLIQEAILALRLAIQTKGA